MADLLTESEVDQDTTLSCGVPNCVYFVAICVDRLLGHAVEEVMSLMGWEESGPYWEGWDEGFREYNQIR